MLDERGGIVSWNLSAERMTGYAPRDVVGKNYSIFFSKEEIRGSLFQKALDTAAKKGNFVAEGIRVRKDGSHFWARSFLTRVRDDDGGPLLFVLIMQDMTEGRAVEQKREEYIGIASHELKNPIATLSLYSELLARRLELDRDKENLQILRDMQGQATRLVNLVDDLLTVSKIEGDRLGMHKESFNPNTFVEKIIHDFKPTAPAYSIRRTGTCARAVYADKVRIAQVLVNLLTNAVKYSPESGNIVVHVGRQKNKCVISVKDSGSGIAKKDQREIFTRFFRTRQAESGETVGSGLGLYISKEIIARHKERLWVESTLGKGSTFAFSLPLT